MLLRTTYSWCFIDTAYHERWYAPFLFSQYIITINTIQYWHLAMFHFFSSSFSDPCYEYYYINRCCRWSNRRLGLPQSWRQVFIHCRAEANKWCSRFPVTGEQDWTHWNRDIRRSQGTSQVYLCRWKSYCREGRCSTISWLSPGHQDDGNNHYESNKMKMERLEDSLHAFACGNRVF